VPAPERAMGNAIVSPRSMNSKTSRTANSAVMKAIGLKPEARLQTVNDFRHILNKKAQASSSPSVAAPHALPRLSHNTTPVHKPMAHSGQTVANLAHENVEMLIRTPTGALTSHRHTTLGNKMLDGQYMVTTLERVLINLRLKSRYNGGINCFTGLEMSFHNVWKYRLPTYNSIKIIDSQGFQYAAEYGTLYEYDYVIKFKKSIAELGVESPENELEDDAKTKGWIWFKKFPNAAVPRRVVVSHYVFDPGHTSGGIRDEEFQKFKIDNFDLVEIEAI
jgi:hypothetical protein